MQIFVIRLCICVCRNVIASRAVDEYCNVYRNISKQYRVKATTISMEANFYKANCSHYTNSLASLCMCDLSQLVHRMRMHHQMDEKQIEQLFDACEHTANNKNLIRASHRRVAVQKETGHGQTRRVKEQIFALHPF